jgi:DDE_Tnp_1-associated
MLASLHPSILRHLAAVDDPRQSAKVVYPLAEILLLALAATIAGADDFAEVTLWGGQNPPFLRRFRPYANGIPSHALRPVRRDRSGTVQGLLPRLGRGTSRSLAAGVDRDRW